MKKRFPYIVVAIIFIYFVYRSVQSSVFIGGPDRVNILFYGKNSVYYSLGNDGVNYVISFSPEIEFLIPGGYGFYKIGALGKLVTLEKKPELFRRAFSVNTSSLTDIYFYPKNPIVYYDSQKYSSELPSISDIFLSSSNASFLDRIFVYIGFLNKNKSHFLLIDDLPVKSQKNRVIFDRDEFSKQYQGRFYRKAYRQEKSTVQLVYTKSFHTAEILSQVLEGEGIRVVDITNQKNSSTFCSVFQSPNSKTQTAKTIGSFFGCRISVKQTELSDIIFQLGPLEDAWFID